LGKKEGGKGCKRRGLTRDQEEKTLSEGKKGGVFAKSISTLKSSAAVRGGRKEGGGRKIYRKGT